MLVLWSLALLAACEHEANCEPVVEEWEKELAAVTSCETAEDCAYPLPGTSCGCTHNAIASTEDTEDLYYILQLGDDLDCELIPDGACDCPEAKGFLCTGGQCAWDYVGDGL